MVVKKNQSVPTPEEFLERFLPHTQSLAGELRELAKEAVPDCIERVIPGWAVISYRIRHRSCELYYCFISPKPEAVYMGWKYGVLLPDPERRLDGQDLKQVRFVTIRSSEEIDAEWLKALTREGAELAVMPGSIRMHMMAERDELARDLAPHRH